VAFNPNDETMFLVGTDEGLIYKCTTEYSSRYENIGTVKHVYNYHPRDRKKSGRCSEIINAIKGRIGTLKIVAAIDRWSLFVSSGLTVVFCVCQV